MYLIFDIAIFIAFLGLLFLQVSVHRRSRVLDDSYRKHKQGLDRRIKRHEAALNPTCLSHGWALDNLRYDQYTHVGGGVYDRLVRDKYDYKVSAYEEGAFKEHIKDIDFSNWIVVFVKFDNEVEVDYSNNDVIFAHYHDVEERIFLIKGSYKDDLTEKKYNVGDTYVIPAGKIHSFSVIEKGCALLMLRKPTCSE